MSGSRRLNEIERLLDNMDPDSAEYAALDAEGNEIAEGLNRVEEAYQARLKAKEVEQQAKLDNIRNLVSLGKVDQLIAEYGHEFIDDYHIDGSVITSHVSEEQWTEEDTKAKLKQLLYYRIYDHYMRIR